MKKNKFTEFLSGKGYYVLLFVGVLAIAAVAFIGSNLSSENLDQDKDYVDLNEPDSNIAAEPDTNLQADNNNESEDVANQESDNQSDSTVVENDNLLEYDVYAEDESDTDVVIEDQTPATNEVAQVEEVKPEVVETSGTTVKAETTPVYKNLDFQVDKGLLWPVAGNIIMNYSMNRTIRHETQGKYATHDAVLIAADVGTEVKAAADGMITSIEDSYETGFTVTMDIGNGYTLVYGELEENESLKVGDRINEGQVISTVSNPSRYYLLEDSNLYFKVLYNDEPVNPMLYLR